MFHFDRLFIPLKKRDITNVKCHRNLLIWYRFNTNLTRIHIVSWQWNKSIKSEFGTYSCTCKKNTASLRSKLNYSTIHYLIILHHIIFEGNQMISVVLVTVCLNTSWLETIIWKPFMFMTECLINWRYL